MAIAARPYLVRPMTLDDIPRVMEIERQSFPAMWPQTLYTRELEQNKLARYLVAERAREDRPSEADGESGARPSRAAWLGPVRRLFGGEPQLRPDESGATIDGFAGMWFMVGESHIVTIAVEPERRRQGLGELLLLAAIDLSMTHGQEVMSLECRVSNTGAQALYEKYGFHRTGIRPRYYSDNHEDAVIMTTEAMTSPRFQERLAELRRRHEERWGPYFRSSDMLR